MVSFQCDGCQDVVKKPKLDSHGARCHASFTCIDCSKTFAGPAQWKGHTSCISEEQKYHKSVYQEPRGRGRGRGQRGGRGGRGGRPSYGGSGENAIPLGPQINAWTAPPPDPVNNEPFNSSEWTANNDKAPTEPQSPGVTTSTTVDVPESEKKSKKSKKRKAEEIGTTETTPADATTTEEPVKKKKKKQADEPVVDSINDVSIQQETKDKKKKSRNPEVGNDNAVVGQNGLPDPDTVVLDVETSPEKKAKKERKEKKKESKKARKSEAVEEVTSPNTIHDHPPTQSNGEAPATVPLATFVDNNARPSTSEETSSKKKSKSKEVTEASNGIEAINGHCESNKKEKTSKKDKKDKKKGKRSDEDDKNSLIAGAATSEPTVLKELPPDANDLIPIPTIEPKNEKKEKVKKDKKKKSKDTDALPTTEPEQVEIRIDESKKSKKRKAKEEPIPSEGSAPTSDSALNGATEGNEKPKKKSKRRDKEVEVASAT